VTVRWAFVGAGRHARLWAAPAVTLADQSSAVGVWSRQPENARAFGAEYRVPRVYPTLEGLLRDPEVDAVYISTPNNLHAAHALAALDAGKHVLCEKPMATSVDDAGRMVSLAREAGLRLGTGFHLRHNRVIEEARRRLAEGAIGTIRYATAQFSLTSAPPPRLSIAHAAWKRDPQQMGGAGALMGLGVHVIDLLRALVDREVVAVQAHASGGTAEAPLETFGHVLLEFEGGAQGYLSYGGNYQLSRNDAVVYGAAGRLVAADVVDVASAGSLQIAWREDAADLRTEIWRPDPADHYRLQFEAFSRAVRDGTDFRASGVDGLRVVEITAAILESKRRGCRVPVSRLDI
jgi:1,5-anhydro-D-fructose reductase (1,5-anhydro-D-mannitol-forming)